MVLYCFEKAYIKKMLNKCKESDLAVIDTDGISAAAIKAACVDDVWVYRYINTI